MRRFSSEAFFGVSTLGASLVFSFVGISVAISGVWIFESLLRLVLCPCLWLSLCEGRFLGACVFVPAGLAPVPSSFPSGLFSFLSSGGPAGAGFPFNAPLLVSPCKRCINEGALLMLCTPSFPFSVSLCSPSPPSRGWPPLRGSVSLLFFISFVFLLSFSLCLCFFSLYLSFGLSRFLESLQELFLWENVQSGSQRLRFWLSTLLADDAFCSICWDRIFVNIL